jgi:hypothetical protein
LCFVVALVLAPLPARAQGPSSSLNAKVAALEAAVTALQGRVAKLEGNIIADDLMGTYSVYLLGISMDPPGSAATFNEMSSYAFAGTATLGGGFRGSLSGTIGGRVMTEQAANLNWTNIGGSGAQGGGFSWSYNNGILTITPDPGVQFKDFDLSVIAGGQAAFSANGGPPSNNQQLTVWTRQP